MLTRRAWLQLVPTSLVATALGACRSGNARTPSDADREADDTDREADDTEPGVDDTEDPADPSDTDTAACVDTPDDIEGPFYRPGAPARDDLARAGDTGRSLLLSGRVLAEDGCTPIPGAVIDLWQADPEGVYDNASSAMHYRARVTADAEGRWSVRTLEPGRYLNGARYRPAHLHVKVWVEGVERLTTQLYFPDDPFNDSDPWYDPALEVVVTGAGRASFDFVV